MSASARLYASDVRLVPRTDRERRVSRESASMATSRPDKIPAGVYGVGHYHSLPENPEDGSQAACFWRLRAGITLMHNAGDALEQIPTITNRAVAARRRRHR